MFDSITAPVKAAIAGGVVVLALIIAGVLWYQHREIKTITKDNVLLDSANKGLADTVDKQQDAAKITDSVVTSVINEKASSVQAATDITNQTEQAKGDIEHKYNALPKPASLQEAQQREQEKEKETSRVQMRSVWQAYCEAKPENPKCADILKIN